MNNIDEDFLQSYPKLYPLAYAMGIKKDELDEIFEKLDKVTWIDQTLDHNRKQLQLRMMMARLNHFELPFNLEEYKNSSDEDIEKIFGKYSYKFAKSLLKVI